MDRTAPDGVHVFALLESVGLRPAWVRAQIGMQVHRWRNLQMRRNPWREEELEAVLRMLHGLAHRLAAVGREDLAEPGALVLKPGEYHRPRRRD